MTTIFISYRRDDSAGYAGRLHEELTERLGPDRVFRDVDTLQPGQDFVDAIEQRLHECRVCLVLVGRLWLSARDESGRRRIDRDTDYVRLEIAAALARADVLVVPVLIGGAVMPAASALPDSIQALGRRQAVTLRDDTWENDVDRLATAIRRQLGEVVPAKAGARTWRRWAIGAAVLAVLLAGAWLFRVGLDSGETSVVSTDLQSSSPAPTPAAGAADTGAAFAIEIPRMPEISHGDLIYTVLAGSVRPGVPTSTLWLRVRVSNEGRYDANLWDQSFRVAVGGEVVAASGGLNEILSGHSIRQVVVRFEIPPGDPRARLRIEYGGSTGELPLNLTSMGSPPTHAEPDPRDALSHADIRALVREPTALVATGDLRATVTRATARRFANIIRIAATVRLENRDTVPRFSGDAALRLATGGELLAPTQVTTAGVEPRSTTDLDVVFELPPDSKAAVLRGTVGAASGEIPLKIQ
jgi:hypothetical protein